MLKALGSCRQHLDSVDESYAEHLRFAGKTGFTMILAGMACVIHGVLPMLFERTGSSAIASISNTIRQRAARPPRIADAPNRISAGLPIA